MNTILRFTVLTLLLSAKAAVAQTSGSRQSDIMVWDGIPLDRSCDKNQMTVNQCAFEVWQRADAELNALYDEQIEYLTESQAKFKTSVKTKQRLIAAQRAWIAFRDRDCEYQVGEGGSSAPFEQRKCMYKRTITRIEELRAYVNCRYNGCPF